MPSILFLLPNAPQRPVGGYKVVYEYANRLCNDGYNVKIVYGVAVRPIANPLVRLAYKTLRWFRFLKFRFLVDWHPLWFDLDKRVEQYLRYDFSKHSIPKTDFYVATAWSTAPWLAKYKGVSDNHKFYLIQSFESWSTSTKEVESTWMLSLRKIVIAPWLLEKAHQLGVDAVLIENGFDQSYFKLSEAIETRNPLSISMLYHPTPLKGCADGLQVIELVKKKYTNIQFTLFGAVPRPDTLPQWMTYYQQPDQPTHNQIYNNSAIFIAPSHIEGFALTPPEAMLCGAAVCATDIGGYTIVCHDNKTALLCPVGDIQAMANNVIKLIENDHLRITLATNALANIKKYTWQNAYEKFITLIRSTIVLPFI